ncbi:MAG: polysaccharide export protein [Alphaproteobacteria bacterium]|nr:polysaccharide export protein [Alphaproteobacteria bacterium]
MVSQRFLIVCLASLVSACGSLPSAGPSVTEVETGVTDDDIANYLLVDIDARIVDVLSSRRDAGLYETFGDNAPAPDLRIGVGDTVSVTIWEVGPGGLFSPAPVAPVTEGGGATGASTSTIPPQIVSRDGDISIPFAGRVHVAGLTPEGAEAAIRGRLSGQAMEPQVLVSVVGNVSGTVSVMGEVTGGARVPLTLRGDRILDVIASAGGIKTPVYDTVIQLTRGGSTATVPMKVLLDNPRENIFARPGDVVTVSHDTRIFMALGASGQNAEVPFGSANLTLIQAIGKSGGVLDNRADPEGVFVMRYESPAVARELDPRSPLPEAGQPVPVVYRLDLEQAKAFFYGQRFAMVNGDIMYISTAPLEEWRKALSLFQTVVAPVTSTVGMSNAMSR